MRLKESRKDILMATIDDTITRFLYYDRKEDEDLPLDAIQEMIESGEIELDEILGRFRTKLLDGLGFEDDNEK